MAHVAESPLIGGLGTEVPNEDWTIAQLMEYQSVQCRKETMEKAEKIKRALAIQLQEGKDAVWAMHQAALEKHQQQQQDSTQENGASRGKDPGEGEPQANAASPMEEGAISSSSVVVGVHILILTGKYKGQRYLLKPTMDAPCLVGRSGGKKFKERGISLVKEQEVSTTHGKFELTTDGTIVFVDSQSTNGTFYQQERLTPYTPLELKDGMELMLGSTVMSIQLAREG